MKKNIVLALLLPFYVLGMDHAIEDSIKKDSYVYEGCPFTKEEMDEVLENAHHSIKAIPNRLRNNSAADFTRYIFFVGKPGTFKTTTAHAIAYKSEWSLFFLSSSNLIRGYRNQTCVELEEQFKVALELTDSSSSYAKKIVFVIDEIDALINHAESKKMDTDTNAKSLQVFLDRIRLNKNLFFIGIANSFENIPDALKDRFLSNMVVFNRTNDISYLRNIFIKMITNESTSLDYECDDVLIDKLIISLGSISPRILQGVANHILSFIEVEQSQKNKVVCATHLYQAFKYVKDGMELIKYNTKTESETERLHNETLRRHIYYNMQAKLSDLVNTTILQESEITFLKTLDGIQKEVAAEILLKIRGKIRRKNEILSLIFSGEKQFGDDRLSCILQ